MPRQFFTLKSILTAPPGSAVGGASVSSTAGIGTHATLEGGVANEGATVAVHDLNVFDAEHAPDQAQNAVPHRLELKPQANNNHDDDNGLFGAPSTSQDEIVFDEDEEEPPAQEFIDGDEEYADEVPQEPAPQMQQPPAPRPQQQIAPAPPPQPPPVPQPPPMPPPVARFSNIVTYDKGFEPVKGQIGQILGTSLNEVMRLRARAAEAFEKQAEAILADLACTVLGRELRTDPADLANIISQMRSRMLGDSAVKIRVSPEDAPYINGPVIADPELGFGDIVFETDDGEIDMRLGTRIAGLLRNQQVQL